MRNRSRAIAVPVEAVVVASASLLTAALVAAAALPAAAQEVLSGWDYERLKGGRSAEDIIDNVEVHGVDGERIGEVEDLVIGPDGFLRTLIIEGGGFLDIGDTHFAYPFRRAHFTSPESIEIQLAEDNVEDYSLFREMEDVAAERRSWRMSELLNDYAYVREGVRYGWIDDAIIGPEGKVVAVVVVPDVTYGVPGPYAVPFDADAFNPGAEYTVLPYSPEEIQELEVYVAD